MVHVPRASLTSDAVRHGWLFSSRVPARSFEPPPRRFRSNKSTARTRQDLPSRATAPRCTLAPLLIGAARGRRYETPHDPSDFTADLTLRFASMPPTPSSAQDWSIPSPGCAFRRRGLRLLPLHAEPLSSPPPRLRVTMRPHSSDRAGLTFEANTPLGFRRAWPSLRATLSGQHAPRSLGGSVSPERKRFRVLDDPDPYRSSSAIHDSYFKDECLTSRLTP